MKSIKQFFNRKKTDNSIRVSADTTALMSVMELDSILGGKTEEFEKDYSKYRWFDENDNVEL